MARKEQNENAQRKANADTTRESLQTKFYAEALATLSPKELADQICFSEPLSQDVDNLLTKFRNNT